MWFYSCGYRLARTDRSVLLTLAAEGAVHPDAVPALHGALAARLRDEGFRIGGEGDAEELRVILVDARETAALPAGSPEAGFEPAAWDLRLRAAATLHRSDGSTVDLGSFDGAAVETAGPAAPADEGAQRAACAAAARALAERIVAAVLATGQAAGGRQ